MAEHRYETLVLIHPEQGEGGAKDLTGRIQGLLAQQGCAVSQVQEWGLRDLAYPVAKQRRGFYVLFEYRGTPKALTEVERNLRLMEPVLRSVSLRQAENAPPAPARHVRRPDREEGEAEGGGGPDLDELVEGEGS
jgi:small subunit ribosomal protein S6